MLDIKAISVVYGKNPLPAVRDFSLQMKPGEIVSIVGESGRGKTTLIRAVLGSLPAADTSAREIFCLREGLCPALGRRSGGI